MHCGVIVTGHNDGDWDRLMAGDYDRPPDVADYLHMEETLAMGELVEPLGFDSIWTTEHYGSPYSMQPNPLQYLAYWAGRTSRLDMGTAVIVAPWWNPVRLAHEVSMLDILLRGRRLHLGIGRGVAPHEYASLGVPLERSHDYFYDVVDVLRASDGAERFSFDGEVFKVPPTTVRPQARHKGSPSTSPRCRCLAGMAVMAPPERSGQWCQPIAELTLVRGAADRLKLGARRRESTGNAQAWRSSKYPATSLAILRCKTSPRSTDRCRL